MVCFIIHWQFLNLRSITLIERIPPSAHQKKSYSLFNLVKVAIRRHVGTGGIVLNAEDCINFLERKYQSKENPNFVLKLISKESLLSARQGDQFSTTQGSSKFHVMIFSPNSNSFKAAPYLCVCDSCLTDYGSCDLFQTYDVPVPQKKRRPPTLRSNHNEKNKDPILPSYDKKTHMTILTKMLFSAHQMQNFILHHPLLIPWLNC